MTREEYIQRLVKFILPAVYKAEDELRPQLDEILHKGLPKEEAANQYLRMVAEKIASHSTDEEIAQIE